MEAEDNPERMRVVTREKVVGSGSRLTWVEWLAVLAAACWVNEEVWWGWLRLGEAIAGEGMAYSPRHYDQWKPSTALHHLC